jgi:8-oxo-dGTP diphosphatase
MKVITVAAGIVLNDAQQLLLVRKKNTSCFMQVGGKLEPNEVPECTILREIEEELGTKAEVKHYLGRFETMTANEPDHCLVAYVYHVELHQAPEVQAEIDEMIWLDLDDQTYSIAPLTREVVLPWVKANLIAA